MGQENHFLKELNDFILDGFHQQKVNTKTGEVLDSPVGMMDVYQEFNELAEKFKIVKFKSKVSAILSYGPVCLMGPDVNGCLFSAFLSAESGEELRF